MRVCFECHALLESKTDRFARCSNCGHGIPVPRRPLFVVTGADGCGKSTLVPYLSAAISGAVVLDKDLLFGPWSDDREHSRWLRLAFGLAMSGYDLVLMGMIESKELESSDWRFLVACIFWCLMDCEDEERIRRLSGRPKSAQFPESRIADILADAHALRAHSLWSEDGNMRLDTTNLPPAEGANELVRWVERARNLVADDEA